jgi:endonuclease/exonuclease/phosphatase family metal-dependent hydrolase
LKLRLLTWNIQYGSANGLDGKDWPRRRPRLIAAIDEAAPDIFCAQETLVDQLHDLMSGLATYSVIAEGRDGPGLGEHCPIFFRNDTFDCQVSGTFWFNDYTTRPGKTWDTKYNRICTWAELRDLRSHHPFRVWNTHFSLDAMARKKSIQLLLERVASTITLPTLVVGDFNEPNSPEVWPDVCTVGLQDAFTVAKQRTGDVTYAWPGLGPARIDWILVTPAWHVHHVQTIGSFTEHSRASDHSGVLADLELR